MPPKKKSSKTKSSKPKGLNSSKSLKSSNSLKGLKSSKSSKGKKSAKEKIISANEKKRILEKNEEHNQSIIREIYDLHEERNHIISKLNDLNRVTTRSAANEVRYNNLYSDLISVESEIIKKHGQLR